MAEILAHLWVLGASLMQEPKAVAAFWAFAISWLIGNRTTAVSCAAIAYSSVTLILEVTGLEEAVSGGVGAAIALIGVHTIHNQAQGLNIKDLIVSAAKALRGKK